MARIFPQKYIQKIEDIKRLVLIRSKLLSEFGNEGVKMELDDYSYDQKLDIFHELIFFVMRIILRTVSMITKKWKSN